MTYTIDILLAELGQTLPMGNGERYRQPVKRYLRYVFGRIGLNKTADVYVIPFELKAGYIDPLPDHILDVLDAGLTADHMAGEQYTKTAHSRNPLAFIPTAFGIRFPNLESEMVYLECLVFPVDETNTPFIMEEVYQACFDYCYAKLLTNFPNHPRYREARVLENDALGMIDQARAQLNKRGAKAHNRVLRKYL